MLTFFKTSDRPSATTIRRCVSQSLCLLIAISVTQISAQDRIEFNRDIRPILSENCYYCHGNDASHREAGMRLDTFEGAEESGVISPGDPDDSELLYRILSDDPDEIMPPPDSEKKVTPEQAELIRRWIEQGAEYQEHWAWRSLQRPKSPDDTKGAAAIDAFLERGWQEQKINPVEMANPRQRIRRLSYDLRGLPPTIEEVAEFQKSPTQEKFLEFRQRWMSELSYAEHQSVRWLDLVRWADTSGFVSDEPIASGAYRAWIVNSFRDNMPFDKFSIAQLAGDLLPEPTDDDLIASGYNRIVNTNCEAGAIEEEQLYKLKGEHVRAFGGVWLGLTTGCAECHDHKFDPFSAKDYYSMAAFFDDLVEAGVYTPGDRREPLHYVHQDSADSKKDKQLAAQIQKLIRSMGEKPESEFEAWEKETKAKLSDKKTRTDFVWITGSLPWARLIEGPFEFVNDDEKVCRQTRAEPKQFQRHFVAETITGFINQGSQKTDEKQDAWFVDLWIDPDDRPDMIGVQLLHGDYGRLGWERSNYETYYWGEDSSETLDKKHPWSDPKRVKHLGDLPEESGWVRLRIPYPKRFTTQFSTTGMAWMHTGGRLRWHDSGLELRTDKTTALTLAETAMRKWWEKPWNRQVFQHRLGYVVTALKAENAKRDELQKEIVLDAFRERSQPERLAQLRSLERKLGLLRAPAMPVLVSRQAAQRKTTRLLNRGDYSDKTGPVMSPETPDFLDNPLPESATRLDLAKWLFNEKNSLTPRVYVNRLWYQFFGRGLSDSLGDSGSQGEWPSNVLLLDWLACEFRDSGWDRDHMVRLLTSTKAYQLSSQPTAELESADPKNQYHARQNRFRLNAESIRDSALLAAGLLRLDDQVPNESFFPYQPGVYWKVSNKVMFGSRHMNWNTSESDSQYGRTMYTFWKRQNIHPTLLAFDAPTRQECTARRNITNTPGQALALLNDPIFVEAARVLATKICENDDLDDGQRLELAYRNVLQRLPSAAEQETLLEMLKANRQRYSEKPDDAHSLLEVGQAASPTEDESEIAAWTIVTRVILNLHETLTRD